MRSISWKLLIAFFLVSVSGTVLFFFIARNFSNREIQDFLFDQDQIQIVALLESHYADYQSWDNIHLVWQQWQPANRPEGRGSPFTLIDAHGVVIQSFAGPGGLKTGYQISPAELEIAEPITVDDEVVGYLFFPPDNPREFFRVIAQRTGKDLDADRLVEFPVDRAKHATQQAHRQVCQKDQVEARCPDPHEPPQICPQCGQHHPIGKDDPDDQF